MRREGGVPEVTLLFWIIEISATTLGETGGDAVSMSMNLGYFIEIAIFVVIFLISVMVQIEFFRFYPVIYWTTIVAATTVGTTLADFSDRSLGIYYAGGASLLFLLVLASHLAWRLALGSVPNASINNPKTEMFWELALYGAEAKMPTLKRS